MGGGFLLAMDLCFAAAGASVQVIPRSPLGMLWLQTHFETESWDLICSGQARLTSSSCVQLSRDARRAGLAVGEQPATSSRT